MARSDEIDRRLRDIQPVWLVSHPTFDSFGEAADRSGVGSVAQDLADERSETRNDFISVEGGHDECPIGQGL